MFLEYSMVFIAISPLKSLGNLKMTLKNILMAAVACLVCWAGSSHARVLGDLTVHRADGAVIKLIDSRQSSSGDWYYLYSEGEMTKCRGDYGYTDRLKKKAQNMYNMAVVLGMEGKNAKVIAEDHNSTVMWDDYKNYFVVSLPTLKEIQQVWSNSGDWIYGCIGSGLQVSQRESEFLTATPLWGDHATYDMQTGRSRQLPDHETRHVALRVQHISDFQVCFFEHESFSGRHKCLDAGDVRWVGDFPDGSSANDTFSSVVVGKYCSVTLFEHGDFGGAQTTINASKSSTLPVFKLNGASGWSWNDTISSVKVNCR